MVCELVLVFIKHLMYFLLYNGNVLRSLRQRNKDSSLEAVIGR